MTATDINGEKLKELDGVPGEKQFCWSASAICWATRGCSREDGAYNLCHILSGKSHNQITTILSQLILLKLNPTNPKREKNHTSTHLH